MNDIDYKPKAFKGFYESNLGQRVWAFLNTPRIFDLMRLTSDLGKPAAEGIGDLLIEEFGAEVDNEDNGWTKKAIGHMIRPIMEHHGYEIVGTRVFPCTKKKDLFKNAAKYKRK